MEALSSLKSGGCSAGPVIVPCRSQSGGLKWKEERIVMMSEAILVFNEEPGVEVEVTSIAASLLLCMTAFAPGGAS